MFPLPVFLSHILLTSAFQIVAAPPPAAPSINAAHAHGASPVSELDPQTSAAFERLRTLVGTWDMTSTSPSGRTYKDKVIYRLASGGSVLFEEIGPAASMLTTYHLDNGKLMLTHFCTVGNQPRMRLRSVGDDGRRLAFEIYDITNLSAPEAYHSTKLDVEFIDGNRVRLVYTGVSAGSEQRAVFDMTRKIS